MKEVYVIIYENSNPEANKKPVRGVMDHAFTSFEQAALQANKLNKKFKDIVHRLKELPVVED